MPYALFRYIAMPMRDDDGDDDDDDRGTLLQNCFDGVKRVFHGGTKEAPSFAYK